MNFAVATLLPKIAQRFGRHPPWSPRVALTLAGMAWLAQVDTVDSYLTGVALPMVLIGAGQGLAFAPLTSFGISASAARTPAPPAAWLTPPTSSAWPLAWPILVAASANAAVRGVTGPDVLETTLRVIPRD